MAARSARYIGNLRILTVNDVYSANPVDGSGGWATLATLLHQHRTPTSILCINGDFLGGSALSEHHQGRNVIEILNELRTDLVCIGNHEFDFGQDGLKQRMEQSKFRWLGSNIREKPTESSTEAEETLFQHVDNLHQIRLELQREVVAGEDVASSSSSPSPFPPSTTAVIGLFGLCTTHTPHLSWPGPLVSFAPVTPVLEECVAKLRGVEEVKQGEMSFTRLPRPPPAQAQISSVEASSASASSVTGNPVASSAADPSSPSPSVSDAIVAVTHLSYHEDCKLARQHGQSVSVFIGGHDHDAIASVENGALIFKAGQNAEHLGIIDLRIEITLTEPQANGTTTATAASSSSSSSPSSSTFHRAAAVYPSWNMISNRGYIPDPIVQGLIDSSIKEMEAAQAHEDPNEVICKIGAPVALPPGVSLTPELASALLVTKTSAVRKSTASFPHLVADAMAYHYREDGCDGAMINGGFIRGDKVYAQGTILTLRDIRYELPFPKVAVLLRISGRGIWTALNQMLETHPNPSGSYPHMSHQWEVTFNPAAPAGTKSKVQSILHEGKPIEMEKIYKLSVTTFMATGGDGITGFPDFGTIVSKDSWRVADLVIAYLKGIASSSPNGEYHPAIVPRVKATEE